MRFFNLFFMFRTVINRSILAAVVAVITAFVLFFVPKSVFGDSELPPYTVGPGGGGALYHPAVNPHDSNNFFITCDMGSAFVTHDGGKSFKSLLLGRSVSYAGMPRWWFTPHSENTVYATVGTVVYVSYDKGKTWDFMFPSKDDYVGLAHVGTGNPQPHFKTGTLQANFCLLSFYVHPTDKNRLYALSAGKSFGWPMTPATVYWSTDGGKTWDIFKELRDERFRAGGQGSIFHNEPIFTVWVDQLQGTTAQMMLFENELRIAAHQGLIGIDTASRDITTIRRIDVERYTASASGGFNAATNMAVKNNQMTVYMTMWEGNPDTVKYVNQVFKSTDFGQTWQPITNNFIETALTHEGRTFQQHLYDTWYDYWYPNMRVTFKHIAAADGKIYVSFNGGDWRVHGVAMTEDDGISWTIVLIGTNKNQREGYGGYANQFSSVWIFEDKYGNTAWSGVANQGLGVNPSNPDQVIATNMGSAYLTTNGGRSWSDLSSRRTDGGNQPVPSAGETPFWATKGIDPAGQSVLAINPFDLNHHLTGWTDIGMFESFDGGKSWTSRTTSSSLPTGNCHAIAFDPHNKGVILAAFTSRQGANLADIVSVNSSDAARAGGMARSTDGGETWTISYLGDATANLLSDPNNSGLPVRAIINGIAFDPINSGIVYALCSGAGVYKSADGGITWTYFNNGITLQSHTVSDVTKQGIFGNLRLGKDNKTLFLTNDGIAYQLDMASQANTWIPINSPANTQINRIEMGADGVLYAATSLQLLSNDSIAFNGGTRSDAGLGGVYASTDKGETWQQLFDEIYQVTDIKSDSRNSNILYLTARMGKVYTANKGAETRLEDWVEADGFNFHHPTHIFEDPQNPLRFYVATNCGGTWSIPLPEDTVNNIPDYCDIADGEMLKVYPNPTNGKLSVESYKVYKVESIEIFDVVGRKYDVGAKHILPNDEITIDISHLANGLYFLKAGNKTVKVVKR